MVLTLFFFPNFQGSSKGNHRQGQQHFRTKANATTSVTKQTMISYVIVHLIEKLNFSSESRNKTFSIKEQYA